MNDSLGKRGAQPGSSFLAMRAKARSGTLKGKTYPQDSPLVRTTGVSPEKVGQGSGVVKKALISSSRSPYK